MDSSSDTTVNTRLIPRVIDLTRWALLISLSLLGCTALSEETLKLVTGEQYAPFTGSELQDGGVLTALVTQAFARNSIATEVAFRPWTRGYEDSLKLEYAAAFPYIATPEREADFLFSDPLYLLKLRFYVKPDSPYKEGSSGELANAVFCLPAGYEFAGWASDRRDELTFVRPRSIAQCYQMMARGRVDVLISNPANVAYLTSRPGSEARQWAMRELPHPLADMTLHLIVPAHHPEALKLLDDFNTGLQQLHASGESARLLADHPDYQAVLPAQAQ